MNITHQSALTDIQVREEPGAFNLVRTQPFTAVGRGLGLLCLLGTGTSLFFATQPEAEKETAIVRGRSSRARSLPQPQSPQTWDEDEFDEDVDIDPEDLEPSESQANSIASPKLAPGNIFELMYAHRKRHLFIPAETGAGKTTLLLGAIEYGHRHFPEIEFFGSTAKISPWLGLEDQRAEDGKPRILTINPDEPETILPLVARLNWLRRRLRKRGEQRLLCEQENRPYRPRRNVIVLEEWNETLATALRYDRAFNASKDRDTPASTAYANLVDAVESFARCGREDEMAIWIFAQDHQVQNAAVNTGYRKNFGFVVPGRANGGMAGLEDAFLGKSAIVAAGKKSKELMAAAEVLAQEVAALNPERGIVYSNLGGHDLMPVPDLPDIKRKRIFAGGEKPKKTNVVQFQPPQIQAPMQAPIAVNDDEDYWED